MVGCNLYMTQMHIWDLYPRSSLLTACNLTLHLAVGSPTSPDAPPTTSYKSPTDDICMCKCVYMYEQGYNMKVLTWTKMCHTSGKHLVHTYSLPSVSVLQQHAAFILQLKSQKPAVYDGSNGFLFFFPLFFGRGEGCSLNCTLKRTCVTCFAYFKFTGQNTFL